MAHLQGVAELELGVEEAGGRQGQLVGAQGPLAGEHLHRHDHGGQVGGRGREQVQPRDGHVTQSETRGKTINPFPPSVPIWHRLVKLSILI